MTESHRRPWRPSRLQIVAATVLVVVGLAALVTFMLGPIVPPGTTVAGVNIGGLGREAAISKVRAEVARPAAEPLEFDNAGETLIVKPRQAGVWVNAQETVEPLLRNSWNPIGRFFGRTKEVQPVIVVDDAKMDLQMGAFDRLVTQVPVDPQLSVSGTTVTYVPGQQGRTVDRDATRAAIMESLLLPRRQQTLPVIIEEPLVTVSNAEAAHTFAQAAVSGPVTVVIGDVVVEIPAKSIGDSLTFSAIDGDYVPELDGAQLFASIQQDVTFSEEPVDAAFRVNKKGELQIVPSRAGGGVSDEDLANRVLSVLGQDVSAGGSRDVIVPEGERQANFTTADAEALGIKDKLSTFTQKFDYAAYRVTNIGQAAEYVNGTILMPGDTFSMNDTIRERTEENGYTRGIIIGPGGVFEEALGGGVSAATTAVWTGAFFAGMERVDTRAHSVYISRYQPGLEATVAWGIFDMKFRNDSPYPVLITTKMTNTSMTVDFWGTRLYDAIEAEFGPRTGVRQPETVYRKKKDGCSPQTGIPGFSINVDRVFFQDSQEVKRETIRTFYRAAPKVVCGKDPKKEKKSDDQTPDNAAAGDDPGSVTRPTPAPSPGDPEVFENVPAQQVPVA